MCVGVFLGVPCSLLDRTVKNISVPLPFLKTRSLASSTLGWEATSWEPTAFPP